MSGPIKTKPLRIDDGLVGNQAPLKPKPPWAAGYGPTQEKKAVKKQRYFLDQDNDGHWFLVEADHRAVWDAWRDLGPDDFWSWTPPLHTTKLAGGPQSVEFSDPEEL